MIDFRYHLVSLISVFLALAVGIVLGAGPLREPIADSLQAQVDSLREDRDNLRLDLDEANTTIADADSYVTATAGQLLSDTLTGVNVSLVVSDTVDAATVDAVTARLGEAGGTLVGTTTLRETAFAVAEADELLGTLRGLDPTLPEAEDAALSTAAARALAGPAAPTTAAPVAAQETPP
ncbi:copper transporter, partial [Brevibacterium samyangense]|uniref:copper transporter n=1 Tax=Brevibacterium samyangense TaxID=366888 RepID=UPI0031E25C36